MFLLDDLTKPGFLIRKQAGEYGDILKYSLVAMTF
jgi:hypothetical protein